MKQITVFVQISFLIDGLAGCRGGGSPQKPPPVSTAPTEFLYANGISTVSAYSIDANTGALTATNSVAGARGSPSLAATPSGEFLYATDQPARGIDALSVSTTGTLTVITGSPFPVPEANPFLFNFLAVDSMGKFLYMSDKGTNQVIGFTINGGTGLLSAITGGTAASGTGPQQIALDPSSKFL